MAFWCAASIVFCIALVRAQGSASVEPVADIQSNTISAASPLPDSSITPPVQPSLGPLRFSVGQRVECNMNTGEYLPGTVLQQHYTDTASGKTYPYVVRLQDGRMIHAFTDKDGSCRLPKLRFEEGTRLKCHTSMGWQKGTVIATWPITQGMSTPYEVRLDSGDQIYPSEDTDVYCTAHLPRFAVGSEVFCHMPEEGYVAGTVTKIWHNVSGLLVPYQVKLEIGKNIYVQEDTDAFIRQMRFKRNQTVSCKLGAFGERRGIVAQILAKEDGRIIAYKIDLSEGSGVVVINAYLDTDEFCSRVKNEVGDGINDSS